MENLYGKITAELIEKAPSLSEELLARLNTNIKPPEKLAAEQVYIGAMYIVSDQVNSFGGVFPLDEHDHLSRLIIDSPVLVGHRKDSLPIARNFHAEMVTRDNVNWVKVYFYWLKSAAGAESLKDNIDGGIYKECSISFLFSFPECSICGRDIRQCRHRVFETYDTPDGAKRPASFNYRQIDKVLETSLVYRGSVPDTSLTRNLFFVPDSLPDKGRDTGLPSLRPLTRIWDLNLLDSGRSYLVRPAYESLRLLLAHDGDISTPYTASGERLDSTAVTRLVTGLNLPDGRYFLDCRLIGLRGKERLSAAELTAFLENRDSRVRRLEIKVADLVSLENDDESVSDTDSRLKTFRELLGASARLLIPVQIVPGKSLKTSIENRATRHGAELVDLSTGNTFLLSRSRRICLKVDVIDKDNGRLHLADGADHDRQRISIDLNRDTSLKPGDVIEVDVAAMYGHDGPIELVEPEIVANLGRYALPDNLYMAPVIAAVQSNGDRYTIRDAGDDAIVLNLDGDGDHMLLLVRGFSFDSLASGRRFLCDEYQSSNEPTGTVRGRGDVISSLDRSGSRFLRLAGELNGLFVLRPIRLNGATHYLFYRLNETPEDDHE